MARFRNDHGEDRVLPTLGYVLVKDGATFTVPDEEWEHWEAGGFTPLDPRPVPPLDPASEPETAPPAAVVKPVKPAAVASEGTEVA